MGMPVDFLVADKRTGRLSYRREFPASLRPYLPKGIRELKRSLGSKSISEPTAAERFRKAAADYEALASLARKAASGTFDTLDRPKLAFLAETYRASVLAKDEERRLQGEAPDEGEIEAALDGARDTYARSDPALIVSTFQEDAEALLASQGLCLAPGGEDLQRLCHELLRVYIEAWETVSARAAGNPVPTPEAPVSVPSPVLSRSRGKGRENDQGEPFLTIAETILTSARQKISGSTAQATRTALRFFREVHGEAITPAAITRRHVGEWLDLLAQRPSKLPKQEQSVPLPEIVARYADRPDVPRAKGKTLAQATGQLSAIWNKAKREGLISEDLSNPFGARGIQVDAPAEIPQELSPAELQAIFSLPVFTKGERPRGCRGEACYWIPLLLLWTGARPEEIAQLLVSDVSQDADSGRWMLRITDEGEHPHKGPRRLKTSKKGTGRRTFPIPQPILDLEFLAYVEGLRRAGETAMFPMLRSKGERGELFASFGTWWSNYLTRNGITLEGEGRRPAREFRHNWSTAARRSGISMEAMEYIQGHSTAGKSANVRYGSRAALGLEIDKLRFEGVDLSRLTGAR